MTEKRYELIVKGVWDNIEDYELSWNEIVDLLNENEQLKQRNQKLDDKLYFKECDIFDLRKERNSFKERLFYLQNAINNAMEHQKAEIGVNALKDVIADYNDWMLKKRS